MSPLNNSDLARWSDNYFKLFNQRPDLSQVRIPEKPEGFGPMRLIVVVRELLEWTDNRPLEGTQEALKSHLPGLELGYDFFLDFAIPMNDRDPRNGSYAVWVRDVAEADKEFAYKSANDLKAEGHVGITVCERQLLEVDYFFEKGGRPDRQNVTLCTGSRSRGGDVLRCRWRADEGFRVLWCDASQSGSNLRSRRVWV